MSPSYGHAYLTSYGWTGTGTGLRKGAIDRPLAVPPKKNLSGLGKDRDDAFPFWDHLFAAASKAITIKVSSDDEDADDTEDPGASRTDPGSLLPRRTTTGILSNRRPVSGTPASTSGSTTPNADADAQGRLSLLATAKREAAKRGLYARFFRGPVLGPDDAASQVAPLSCSSESSESIATPVPEHVGGDVVVGDTKKRNRKSEETGKAETEEERRERKRLKKERKVTRAAKKAAKALAGKKDRLDRKARKHRDEETQSGQNGLSQYPKKARKRAQKSVAESAEDDLEPAKYTRKRLEEEPGQQDTSWHRLPSNMDATDAINVVLTTKKKKKKRKDHPRHSYAVIASQS